MAIDLTPDEMQAIGHRIKSWRTNVLRLTQEELAELVGWSQPAVCHWEKGRHLPRTFAERRRITDAIGAPYSAIFTELVLHEAAA